MYLVEAAAMAALVLAPPASAQHYRHDPHHPGHHRGCHTYRCDHRMDRKAHRKTQRRWWRSVRPFNGKLVRIASCESGGRWHIATGNGFYGGLQFTLQTWRSVGGGGMPHWAEPLEQKFRAVRVFKRRGGWGDWPVCGYR